jgi:hypothetical protein
VQFKLVRVDITDTPETNFLIFNELNPRNSQTRMLNFVPLHNPDETLISFGTHNREYTQSSQQHPILSRTARNKRCMAPRIEASVAADIDLPEEKEISSGPLHSKKKIVLSKQGPRPIFHSECAQLTHQQHDVRSICYRCA